MNDPQRHEMQLKATYSTGVEEWYCPTCGRRLLVNTVPGCEALTLERGDKHVLVWGARIGTTATTKTLLDPGDEQAVHYGSVPADMISPVLEQAEETKLREHTSSWAEWLEDIDFGNWGEEDAASVA
jgi:hypothetical protein